MCDDHPDRTSAAAILSDVLRPQLDDTRYMLTADFYLSPDLLPA